MNWGIDEVETHPFPASVELLDKLREHGAWSLEIEIPTAEELFTNLRERLAFSEFPQLQNLADTILDLPFTEISFWHRPDGSVQAWFSFKAGAYPTQAIHFPIAQQRSDEFFAASFRCEAIPGLREFLLHFGGLVADALPPGRHFCGSASQQVRNPGEDADFGEPRWGPSGSWEGARVLFHGGSGDQIVIREDGSMAKWSHEVGLGWDAEDSGGGDPFTKIEGGFLELVGSFTEYIQSDLNDRARKWSVFHY